MRATITPDVREKLTELVNLTLDLNQYRKFEINLEFKAFLADDDNLPYFILCVDMNRDGNQYFSAHAINTQYDDGYALQPITHENLTRAIVWLNRKHKEFTQQSPESLNELIARLQDIPTHWECDDFADCPHIADFQELLQRHEKLTNDEPSYKNSKAWDAWAEQHDYLSDVIGELKNQHEDFENV